MLPLLGLEGIGLRVMTGGDGVEVGMGEMGEMGEMGDGDGDGDGLKGACDF